MDLDLPRWQKALWIGTYAFSAAFTVVTLLAERYFGRKP
jgi:hypothetical protein